jgi:hypothetical protein
LEFSRLNIKEESENEKYTQTILMRASTVFREVKRLLMTETSKQQNGVKTTDLKLYL